MQNVSWIGLHSTSRLDQICVSIDVIVQASIKPKTHSDHEFAVAKLNISFPNPIGKGYRKNNATVYD